MIIDGATCRITAAAVAINATPRSTFNDGGASIYYKRGCADNMPSMVYVEDDAMCRMTSEMGPVTRESENDNARNASIKFGSPYVPLPLKLAVCA